VRNCFYIYVLHAHKPKVTGLVRLGVREALCEVSDQGEVPAPGSTSCSRGLGVIQVKRVYNFCMTVFRYGREHYEEGEYVRHKDAVPGDGLDPVVRIVEDLGTIEIPCGKVDCRANCLEYLVRSSRREDNYSLAECKLSPLVSII
jgi:hypothetical protein